MVNRWCLVVTLHPIKLPISKEWPVRKLTLQISPKKSSLTNPSHHSHTSPKRHLEAATKVQISIRIEPTFVARPDLKGHPIGTVLCFSLAMKNCWCLLLTTLKFGTTKDSWNHPPIFLVEIVGKTVKVSQQQLENLGDSMHKQTKSAILSIGVHFPQSQCFYELCKISQDHYTTKRIHKDLSQPSPKASMLGLASMWSRNS